jgi:mono/diheme cytochrome c family protein
MRPRALTTLLLLLALPCASLSCRGGRSDDTEAVSAHRDPSVPHERLASSAAWQRGRAEFLEHCAGCHGAAADGRGVRSSALASRPADLTRLPAARRDPRRLFGVLREGLPGTDMPSWRALDDGRLWDLVAYLQAPRTEPAAGPRQE